MIIGDIDTQKQVYVIAEAGNNHEGDFQKALELVDAAAETGADAVKFQTIVPDKLVSSRDQARIQQLTRFQFSLDQFALLKDQADKNKIDFITTPFALEVVEALTPLVSAFKIASGDLTWHQLIKTIAKQNKPVLLSTGASTMEEIVESVDVYHQHLAQGTQRQIAVLHCVMSYPAPAESLHLNVLNTFKTQFDTIGYSDHYLGIQSCVAAVALGARVIEKHFTLDKNTSDFRDHQLSADLEEMSELVRLIREITPMLGSSSKQAQACEIETQKVARRSPKASRDLIAGTLLSQDDIAYLRPNSGSAASLDFSRLKLKRDLKTGDDFSQGDF